MLLQDMIVNHLACLALYAAYHVRPAPTRYKRTIGRQLECSR